MPPIFNKRLPLLIPAAVLVAASFLIGCEDDPILGPTDREPSGGGSYGIIHFEARQHPDSSHDVRLQEFLKENPRRF